MSRAIRGPSYTTSSVNPHNGGVSRLARYAQQREARALLPTRCFACAKVPPLHRIFDLDNLKAGEKLMPEQHKGPINAAAFNAEGTTAATGGDDRVIFLWNVADSKPLLRKVNAHQAAVTSLAFAPGGQLVSAGRDKGLFLWSVEAGNGNEKYQRILDAAVDVIAENGYFNSPVSAIAARAGVADGTIYLYFEGKEEIWGD